jgi:hypothetical protein
MKTLASLVLGTALIAQAGLAHAIVKFPTIRAQIRQEAKSEGVLKNLVRPSIRVQISGTKATAQIYSIGKEWPMLKETRMLQKTATFKINQLIDGKLAQPVKVGGEVWQQIYRMEAAGNR